MLMLCVLFIGLSSFLVVTEGSPYVSGVISRFEKETMIKKTPHIRNEEDNNERVWHFENNEQFGSTNHQRNTHRRQNDGERQRFSTNTESRTDFSGRHSSHNAQNRDASYFFNDDDERPHWV